LGKRCLFCGLFFVPDPRVRERQKACQRDSCRKSRKRLAQKAWCEKNPDYFKGHYLLYVKPWRGRKGVIKDKIPWFKPHLRLILLIPGEKIGMIKDEMDRAVRFD
jgi:hypothetical protein